MKDLQHLNSSVWATLKPSPVHGIGVFAIRDIPKGTLITDYSIRNISEPKRFTIAEKDLKHVHKEILPLILDRMVLPAGRKEFTFPSPNSEQTLRSFMNHSKEPNSDGERALRAIKKGEEITEDYSTFGYTMHELSREHYKDLL